LQALADAGAIARDTECSLASLADKLDEKVARYARERREILVGSKALGPEQWAQEVNGSLGRVTGAKELEHLVVKLSEAGDRFDLATVFLHLSLVAGATYSCTSQKSMAACRESAVTPFRPLLRCAVVPGLSDCRVTRLPRYLGQGVAA
jgi:hypothetical protein